MRHLRGAAIMAAFAVVLVIILATALQPLLPYLFVLFIFGCILRIALRD